MASKNDITGDVLQSRINSKAFEDNFDRIFRKRITEQKLNNDLALNEKKSVHTKTHQNTRSIHKKLPNL